MIYRKVRVPYDLIVVKSYQSYEIGHFLVMFGPSISQIQTDPSTLFDIYFLNLASIPSLPNFKLRHLLLSFLSFVALGLSTSIEFLF